VGFVGKYSGSSFSELLEIDHPHLKVNFAALAPSGWRKLSVPEGTTVLALRYADGVLVAGDRLATADYRVASRDVQKVYAADGHSIVAIAGAAGPSIEMAKILRLELEHYEKIEGKGLELEGKANRLSQMIRQNLPAAMQGLVVVPLFAGYDRRRRHGRIFKYDITGGRQEEKEYDSTGSGSLFARESLKKTHSPGASREEALRSALTALTDAADEDRATGGIDPLRGIFPNISTCSERGVDEVPESEIEALYRDVLESRRRPEG
jgi:proteasome beta subunit